MRVRIGLGRRGRGRGVWGVGMIEREGEREHRNGEFDGVPMKDIRV